MKIKKIVYLTTIVFLLTIPMSAFAGQYTALSFTDLGSVEAVAVNNNGMVAGHDGTWGFIWSAGVIDNFGYRLTDSSNVVDINDNGTVVGEETGSMQKNYTYNAATGLLFSNVDMRVTGINNNGTYVGYNHSAGTSSMVDANGNETVMAGIDRAYGINDSDQVVGYIWDGPGPDGWQRGVVYDHGQVTVLGALGDDPDMSFGEVINNSGDVIGTSWTQDWGNMTSYFWAAGSDPDALMEIPNFAGNSDGQTYLYGMNDQGLLAGKSHDGDIFNWQGILYDGEDLINLNDLIELEDGWVITNVNDINNNGMLVGTMENSLGDEHGFVMEVNAVPVPGAVWLLGSGFIGLIGYKKNKKRI